MDLIHTLQYELRNNNNFVPPIVKYGEIWSRNTIDIRNSQSLREFKRNIKPLNFKDETPVQKSLASALETYKKPRGRQRTTWLKMV